MDDRTPLLPLTPEGGGGLERRLRRRKPGIVYLSSIPPNMTVAKMRQYFSRFGALDRVFLQAQDKESSSKGGKTKKFRKSLHFTEGWLEYKSKRKAKQVHLMLNNQPVGGKKKNPHYDTLWNIKYLPRFKWAYLKQRLEYEREVLRQRMGAEIAQVRRETDHFLKLSEMSDKKKRRKTKGENEASGGKTKGEGGSEDGGVESQREGEKERVFVFKQRATEEEKLTKKEERKRKDERFRQRIAEKRKKKQKRKGGRRLQEEDILGSVFVGAS